MPQENPDEGFLLSVHAFFSFMTQLTNVQGVLKSRRTVATRHTTTTPPLRLNNMKYLLNPPSLRTPDGTLVMLSKKLREELGSSVGTVVSHDKESMTSDIRLMEPKKVEKCALCGGPVRSNRTTGVMRCKDLDTCAHSHGFTPTKRLISIPPSEYSVMRGDD